MKKYITQEQINQLLNTIYNADVKTLTFDAIKKFLSELPSVEVANPSVEDKK